MSGREEVDEIIKTITEHRKQFLKNPECISVSAEAYESVQKYLESLPFEHTEGSSMMIAGVPVYPRAKVIYD